MDEDPSCISCNDLVLIPYISCNECPANICLHCFSRGREFGLHKSEHRYCVVKNDFPLFETGWSAEEEWRLLKAIGECGLGNWHDAALQVKTKSYLQCETHYKAIYLDNPEPPLPNIPEPVRDVFPAPVAYRCCESPPRPADSSAMQLEMSGYVPPRGDFTTEFDNFAELDLKEIKFTDHMQEGRTGEDDPVEVALKFAVLDTYHSRLKERQRRKHIVRKYGLIDCKKQTGVELRYERLLGDRVSVLRRFMRLFPPVEFDKYMEGLLYQTELKREIIQLQEHRQAGLTTHQAACIYERLKKRRRECAGRNRILTDLLNNIQDEAACESWLQQQSLIQEIGALPNSFPSVPRKTAGPLDISHLPSYDKLNARERELCKNCRLVPEAYMDFRRILTAESDKYGELRLAQARTLIKIDVNKTRKLFDFLISEGLVRKGQT